MDIIQKEIQARSIIGMTAKDFKKKIEIELLRHLIDQCNQPPYVINRSELERLLNERTNGSSERE